MRVAGALLLALIAPLIVAAQGRRASSQIRQAVEYDGNLTFTRLIYGSGLRNFGFGGAAWSHDYPAADKNLSAIIDYITNVRVRLDGTNVLDLDDPEIFQNPVLYVWEPGYWTIQPSEAQRLREYLLKGGFVIFDDFRGQDWWNLEEQMKRVLPEARFIQLDVTHPVFHSFFDIKDLSFLHSYNDAQSATGRPTYWGIFEDNDPSKRLIAIANRDNDLGEYWEYSDTGMDPIDFSNEAYKYGVNYILYGLMQ